MCVDLPSHKILALSFCLPLVHLPITQMCVFLSCPLRTFYSDMSVASLSKIDVNIISRKSDLALVHAVSIYTHIDLLIDELLPCQLVRWLLFRNVRVFTPTPLFAQTLGKVIVLLSWVTDLNMSTAGRALWTDRYNLMHRGILFSRYLALVPSGSQVLLVLYVLRIVVASFSGRTHAVLPAYSG